MKVLFSRGQNDFEHVYDLPSVPRVGEHVGLLEKPHLSFAEQFVVRSVHWTPDHTAYDVCVNLERVPKSALRKSIEQMSPERRARSGRRAAQLAVELAGKLGRSVPDEIRALAGVPNIGDRVRLDIPAGWDVKGVVEDINHSVSLALVAWEMRDGIERVWEHLFSLKLTDE